MKAKKLKANGETVIAISRNKPNGAYDQYFEHDILSVDESYFSWSYANYKKYGWGIKGHRL